MPLVSPMTKTRFSRKKSFQILDLSVIVDNKLALSAGYPLSIDNIFAFAPYYIYE